MLLIFTANPDCMKFVHGELFKAEFALFRCTTGYVRRGQTTDTTAAVKFVLVVEAGERSAIIATTALTVTRDDTLLLPSGLHRS